MKVGYFLVRYYVDSSSCLVSEFVDEEGNITNNSRDALGFDSAAEAYEFFLNLRIDNDFEVHKVVY